MPKYCITLTRMADVDFVVEAEDYFDARDNALSKLPDISVIDNELNKAIQHVEVSDVCKLDDDSPAIPGTFLTYEPVD